MIPDDWYTCDKNGLHYTQKALDAHKVWMKNESVLWKGSDRGLAFGNHLHVEKCKGC